jgi:hypothetical protein
MRASSFLVVLCATSAFSRNIPTFLLHPVPPGDVATRSDEDIIIRGDDSTIIRSDVAVEA